jgi:hypothetical protein
MRNEQFNGKEQSSYIPTPELTKFLEQRLHLVKKQKEFKEKGKDLPKEDRKLKRKNDRLKIHYLNTHVFRSMANLIVFFEFIKNHPELLTDFEDQIEELLMGWNKNDKGKTSAFARLVDSAIFWEYDRDRFNFRLSLFYMMQRAITFKIPSFAKTDFRKDAGPFGWTISENMVRQDMDRAFAWTGLYARNTLKPEIQKDWDDFRRPVLF